MGSLLSILRSKRIRTWGISNSIVWEKLFRRRHLFNWDVSKTFVASEFLRTSAVGVSRRTCSPGDMLRARLAICGALGRDAHS
jgi:hypothetical protein